MAVPTKAGADFAAGSPVALFERIDPDAGGTRVFNYQAAVDGERFLVNTPAGGEGAVAMPLTVVLNWQAGLKK